MVFTFKVHSTCFMVIIMANTYSQVKTICYHTNRISPQKSLFVTN